LIIMKRKTCLKIFEKLVISIGYRSMNGWYIGISPKKKLYRSMFAIVDTLLHCSMYGLSLSLLSWLSLYQQIEVCATVVSSYKEMLGIFCAMRLCHMIYACQASNAWKLHYGSDGAQTCSKHIKNVDVALVWFATSSCA